MFGIPRDGKLFPCRPATGDIEASAGSSPCCTLPSIEQVRARAACEPFRRFPFSPLAAAPPRPRTGLAWSVIWGRKQAARRLSGVDLSPPPAKLPCRLIAAARPQLVLSQLLPLPAAPEKSGVWQCDTERVSAVFLLLGSVSATPWSVQGRHPESRCTVSIPPQPHCRGEAPGCPAQMTR